MPFSVLVLGQSRVQKGVDKPDWDGNGVPREAEVTPGVLWLPLAPDPAPVLEVTHLHMHMIPERDCTHSRVILHPLVASVAPFTDEETEAQRFWRAYPGVTSRVRMSPKALALRNFQAGSPGKLDGGEGGGRDGGGIMVPLPRESRDGSE